MAPCGEQTRARSRRMMWRAGLSFSPPSVGRRMSTCSTNLASASGPSLGSTLAIGEQAGPGRLFLHFHQTAIPATPPSPHPCLPPCYPPKDSLRLLRVWGRGTTIPLTGISSHGNLPCIPHTISTTSAATGSFSTICAISLQGIFQDSGKVLWASGGRGKEIKS